MKFCISVLFVALATSLSAYAERSENWSISAGAGTSGGTLETTYRFTDHFHLRGGMNTITVSANIDDSDISFVHLVSEVANQDIRIGMRVEAVWKPEDEWGYSFENISHFRPYDAPDVDVEALRKEATHA